MACDYHFDKGYQYSKYIDRVVQFIEYRLGYTVNLFDQALKDEGSLIAGGIWYKEKRISVCCLCAGCTVAILLHEAGHHIAYTLNSAFAYGGSRAEPLASIFGRQLGKASGLNLPDEEEEWYYERVVSKSPLIVEISEQ